MAVTRSKAVERVATTYGPMRAWTGTAAVVDVDDFGLTWSVVYGADGNVTLLAAQTLPHLNLRLWKERLLNLAADRCVLHPGDPVWLSAILRIAHVWIIVRIGTTVDSWP